MFINIIITFIIQFQIFIIIAKHFLIVINVIYFIFM